jgi:nucleolar protein 58
LSLNNFDTFLHFFHQITWLKEFQTFDDQSSAISVGTGVNRLLSEMIMKWRRPAQTLVVGKREYKSVIESSLVSISCMFAYISEQI